MNTPKNQYELVLFYLFTWERFNLADCIKNDMFFKFQTRLSELEAEHGILANRERENFKNRFGHTSSYTVYSAIDKYRVLEVYRKIKKLNCENKRNI